jgi:hypothetical protein
LRKGCAVFVDIISIRHGWIDISRKAGGAARYDYKEGIGVVSYGSLSYFQRSLWVK